MNDYWEASDDKIKFKSLEDEWALSNLEKTTKKVKDNYKVGLLRKSNHFLFPPSNKNALKTLKII